MSVATSAADIQSLRTNIQQLIDDPSPLEETDVIEALTPFFDALTAGTLRAATLDAENQWRADPLVKRGILLAFRFGRWKLLSSAPPFVFSDKHTFTPKKLDLESNNIRIVPGGTTVRSGAHLGPNVTLMPPSYVNVGAYIAEGTLVDSHALVGSCAQIGRRCHLSAGVQIGGVLEPVGQVPVVIEDDVFIGGNSGVYEGTIVRAGAVLAAGTILTRGTRVYDLVNERVLKAEGERSLEIPPNAVVVPGSRPASGDFAAKHGLQAYAPLIVKYRDERTAASTTLEEALR